MANPTMINAYRPMLIHEMIRVAVLRPAPPMRPADSSISLVDERARIRATTAGITGQMMKEAMARTRPMIAEVEVCGGGGYAG